MITTTVVLRDPQSHEQPALFYEAVQLPPTPDTVDSYVPREAYEAYSDRYTDVAEWCGATLCEGVDSRDIYYYYIDSDDFFASDGWWVMQEDNGKFSAHTDAEFNYFFVKQDQ